ncbi:MAG: putative metal-binding motif-containing protein, partial [Cyclobacteriaceae bacterium]|nr:putative metal-binding motif-containing protein [Cyclobacteriaceae bacterium]
VCHYDADTDTWHIIEFGEPGWKGHEPHGDVRLDDQDGDGFVPNNVCGYGPMGDLDDLDPTVYPGAPEICDGKDNDGDGLIDNTGTTYYKDADGDGFGDPNQSQQSCTPLEGFVEDNTDCNDSDSTVNPGAVEICGDGIDNDCDGEVDEDCQNPNLIESLEETTCIRHDNFGNRVGQTFTTGNEPKSLIAITNKISRTCGGNGGGMQLLIYKVNLSNNSFEEVGASNGLPINLGEQRFSFAAPLVLEPNTTYAFVHANFGANFYHVLGENPGSLAGSTGIYFNLPNGTLTPQPFDIWFKIELQ